MRRLKQYLPTLTQSMLALVTATLLYLSADIDARPKAGTISDTPSPTPYPAIVHLEIFLCIFLALIAMAALHRHWVPKLRWKPPAKTSETLCFAIAPLVTSICHLLSFYPANISYDSALQWTEAATPGTLSAPIGIFTTLFMRLFTNISLSPWPLILFQGCIAALGVALVLHEMRHRGVPRRIAQIASIALVLPPHYGMFFNYLSKDALCAAALLYFVWAILYAFRTLALRRLDWRACLAVACSGFFAGAFRINTLPAIAAAILLIAIYFAWKSHRRQALFVLLAYITMVTTIPSLTFYFSAEQQALRAGTTQQSTTTMPVRELPYGSMALLYIYHIFAAAVHSDKALDSADTKLFYQIAPRSSWTEYSCFMTDTTLMGINKNHHITGQAYYNFLVDHQVEMARSVGHIVMQYPSVLLNRQACVTRILWYIGYKQTPFEATLTQAYDGATPEFLALAGENHHVLVPLSIRTGLQGMYALVSGPNYFWLFWKPALPFLLSIFCVLLRLRTKGDIGLSLAAITPVLITLVLAVIIPFPAYRYTYPMVLVLLLISTSLFAKPISLDTGTGSISS